MRCDVRERLRTPRRGAPDHDLRTRAMSMSRSARAALGQVHIARPIQWEVNAQQRHSTKKKRIKREVFFVVVFILCLRVFFVCWCACPGANNKRGLVVIPTDRPTDRPVKFPDHEARTATAFCIHTHTHTSYVCAQRDAKNMRNASQVLAAVRQLEAK